MKKLISFLVMAVIMLGAGMASRVSVAGDMRVAGAVHKVVIQVSTDDPRTQKIALNNAVNLQKLYGVDNVDVVIVAYGPGLTLLTKKNKQAQRVQSLAMQGIRFNACGNTMKKITKKTGKKPQIVAGVKVVPAGVARIAELQEQGYSYIRP